MGLCLKCFDTLRVKQMMRRDEAVTLTVPGLWFLAPHGLNSGKSGEMPKLDGTSRPQVLHDHSSVTFDCALADAYCCSGFFTGHAGKQMREHLGLRPRQFGRHTSTFDEK